MKWNSAAARFGRYACCWIVANRGCMCLSSLSFFTSRVIPALARHDEGKRLYPVNLQPRCYATKRYTSTTSTNQGDSSSGATSRYRLLDERISLRGPVDSGYGRGGKKLGFPTANLPASLFQNALADVTNGVYFGWAVIEGNNDETKGRNLPHKAVVNVGFSPTFEGAENKEKIVEAHLILEEGAMDPPDFYGETMRLQLDAFMRPEQKFPSFPELMAQITADVADSKEALDKEPFQSFRQTGFLVDLDSTWVGSGGGDAAASWEKTQLEAKV